MIHFAELSITEFKHLINQCFGKGVAVPRIHRLRKNLCYFSSNKKEMQKSTNIIHRLKRKTKIKSPNEMQLINLPVFINKTGRAPWCLQLCAWSPSHNLSWVILGGEAQEGLSQASWDIPSPALSQQNLICPGKLNQYLELFGQGFSNPPPPTAIKKGIWDLLSV